MHEHVHEHGHSHQTDTPERQQALLEYMLDHNAHHAEELHELGHAIDGEASEYIHQAVELFNQGNAQLQKALDLLKEN